MDKLINRRVLISMLFIGLTMMGIFSYRFLSMELYPNADLPTLNVSISANSEMDPNYIENQAAIPIEGAISQLEGVEEIATRISERNARITISFAQSVDIKYAYLKLEENVKAAAQSIPDEFSVSVSKSGTNMVNSIFMQLFVLGDEDIDYVRNITDNDITSALENVDGVAGITVMGGRQKSIEITVDDSKCDALNITRAQIASKIASNMSEKAFVGSVFENNHRFFVNVTAEYLNTSDIGSIVIADGPILLQDIAEITFGVKEEESYSRVNGKEVVTCVLAKSPQVNVIDLSERVRKEIDVLNKDLESKGIEIKINSDTAETMSSNIDTIINLGITGAIFAIFILYLFLHNFRIVSFIAFAIPISIFSAFYFFFLANISINTLTLTGIALAVGMLLDNSVVVMENIFRLRALGNSPHDAAVKGTKEVWKSIFASTLTTITVFLPFLFADNYMIKLIGEHIGISIIATLLVSLVVALLLIPMAVNYFMTRHSDSVDFSALDINSRPVQMYVTILKFCLRRPTTIVISAILLLAGALTLSFTMTVNTLKETETDSFDVYITSPSGYTLARTDDMVHAYEEALMRDTVVEQITSKIYESEANITIKLVEDYEQFGTLSEIKNNILRIARDQRIRDISLEAKSSSENFQGGVGSSSGGSESLLKLMGVGSQSEKIIIKGQDFEKMENLAEYLTYQLEELDNISSASYNTSRRTAESQIRFDQYLMGINNVTTQNIATELSGFSPQSSTSVTYKTNDEEYDIIIKDRSYAEADAAGLETSRTLEDLRNMKITNSDNALVNLQNVAKINLRTAKGSINRVNQDKEITVTYRFQSDINESNDVLDAAREEIDDLVAAIDIPSGVAVEIVHEEDDTDDFTFLIFAAFLLIFMILASVFESLSAPIVLMFAIPLAAIGSLLGLLLTDNSFLTANAMTGFIILIGIVVNNSIILIDYTSLLRRNGCTRQRAIITAGISRLRPILITAVTTIVAMFPLAMGEGEFVSGLGAPFAITVIGGLTMSTLLTLVIIPTLYSGLEDALLRLRSQSIKMKILQGVLMVITLTVIYITNSSVWIKFAYLAGAVILIPGITWFVEGSLRQANSNIIAPHEEIIINICNLVKVYGRPSSFVREWVAGLKIRERLGLQETYRSWNDMQPLLWIIPLDFFLAYFSLDYLSSGFWAMIFACSTWLLTIKAINIIDEFSHHKGVLIIAKLTSILRFSIFYFAPLAVFVWFNIKTVTGGSVTLLTIIWYIGILLSNLAKKMNSGINPDNLTGAFIGIRKSFYHLAMKVPALGYRKKPFKALNAVSFNIHTGMFGLLGPNGAGKTTLMRIICGIFEQSYGKIFINGIDTQKKREELQGLIGYLPQEFGTYENLTSWQFLEYQALQKGLYKKDVREHRIREVLEAVHMYENRDRKIGGFSGGMKQRIGIAQTLLNLPRILVVDEPTAGLDPRERIRFRNLLVELSRNRIVIFSTHIIEDIASSCNQVAVINKGSLKYFGTPSEMADIAKNVTWVFETTSEEFERLAPSLLIVHHIRLGENIRVRCLAETAPVPNAVKTHPVLEDSYLWLLHSVKIANNEKIITQ